MLKLLMFLVCRILYHVNCQSRQLKLNCSFFLFLFAFGLTVGILTWGNVQLAVDQLQLQKRGELYNHSEVFVMFYGFRRAEMALKKVTNPAAFYCPQGKEWVAVFYSTSTLRVAQMVQLSRSVHSACDCGLLLS